MKTIISSSLLLMASLNVHASAYASGETKNAWVGGLSYFSLSQTIYGRDVHLGALMASFGYRFHLGHGFYLVPEYKFGRGLIDDERIESGVNLAAGLDRFKAYSLRAQLELGKVAYVFAEPSRGEAELKASASFSRFSFQRNIQQSEYAVGLGFGVNFNKNSALEVQGNLLQFPKSLIFAH